MKETMEGKMNEGLKEGSLEENKEGWKEKKD